jgi:DNA-binding MarR family transcriptional regulator
VSFWNYGFMIDTTRHPNPLIGLIDATSRLRGRLKSAFAGSVEDLGLSDMEMTVLNAVTGSPTPPTVPQIGRALGHPRQVIQRAANALVEAGLIETSVNPDHKRAVLLLATETGEALKREADARGNEIAARLLSSVDPALVIEANELLETLRKQLDAHFRTEPERNAR